MTRPIAGSPLPNAASALIRLLTSAQVWWEADAPPSAGGTVIDASAEPWVFTSILNRGKLGGTFGSAGAARPAVGNVESNGNLHRVGALNGTSQYHISSLPAASFNALHNGVAPVHLSVVVQFTTLGGNQIILGTANNTPNVGMQLWQNAGVLNFMVFDGSGIAAALVLSSPAATLATNTPYLIEVVYGPTLTPNGTLKVNGVVVGTANYARPSSAADATFTLNIGKQAGSVNYVNGWIAAVTALINASADQQVFLENAFSQKYCRPSAPMRQAPTVWLSPALPNAARLDTAAAPTAVDRVWDAGGKAHDASQTTDNKEALLVTLSGQKAVSLDGVNDNYTISVGVGWSANTSHTFMSVVNPAAAQLSAASDSYLFDAQTGRLALFVELGGAGGAGIERTGAFDGAYQIVARAASGLQLVEWQTGTTDSMYRSGVLVGSRAGTNARAVGGQVTIGSLNNSAAGFSSEVIGDWFHRDTQLTGTALWETREYFVQKFGLTPNTALVPDHLSILDPRVSDSVVTAGGAVSRVDSLHKNQDNIADGSCQAAGVTAWTAGGGSVLTKQNAAPRTGTCLRVATLSGHADQSILVAGRTYRITGFARGDGAGSVPTIGTNLGLSSLWIGTNSTNWQAFDVRFTAAGGVTLIAYACNVAGTYVEFDDLTVTDITDGAATQAVAGNQPTHVAGAAGYFQTDGNDYIAEQALLTAASTLYAWIKPASLVVSQNVFGARLLAPSVQQFYAQILNTGLWRAFIGSAAAFGNATATTNWTPVALMASGSGPGYLAVGAEIYSVANIGTNVPAIVPYLFSMNDGGIPTGSPAVNGTQAGPMHQISRVVSVRELMRMFTQEGASYGWSLPAAMTPADWDAQLCGCADLTVTTPGGPVSVWADRLNRAGMGATSPGAASTFPQHSVVDNSVASTNGTQYMTIAAPSDLNVGTYECWFYMPSVPAAAAVVFGATDAVPNFIEIAVLATGQIVAIAGVAGDQVSGQILAAGWHYAALTFTGAAGVSSLLVDGITFKGTSNPLPNRAVALLARNSNGVINNICPTGWRIAKFSYKAGVAKSVAQLMQNYITDYESIVYKTGV